MKQLIRSCCFVLLCSLAITLLLSGCGKSSSANEKSVTYLNDVNESKSSTANEKSNTYLNGMNKTEKSKITTEFTEPGNRITLFDEEIGSSYEINLIKGSTYDASKEAALYLVQGTAFHETQLNALRDYLGSRTPQTLLAIINAGNTREAADAANRDFVENPKAYQTFITDNLLGWICENYKIDEDNVCFAGYKTAGYFAAYMLHTGNSVANYLIINPELTKRTDTLDISTREADFFTGGNTSLAANVCILCSDDDRKILAFSKTDQWIKSLREHNYQGLSLNDKLLAGAGHNVIDCEALLRGICHFSNMDYGIAEEACVAASKAMTVKESESIKVGKLSKEHEFYNEVLGIDAACAEYINEIVMYDEETNDNFVIHVSLPPNYDENKRYPLVLMTDGVWRLSDHPELHKLMQSNELEDVILVSVGYPDGYNYISIRERDLLQQPDLYLQFLTENLVPYLYDNYNVDTARTTLTGHSYGGYWGLYALYHSDTIGKNTFAYYYIGSPSFQARTNNAMMTDFEDWHYERKQSLPYTVYITVGRNEEAGFINMIESRLSDIQKHSYEGLTMTYEVIEGHDHNTVFKPSIRNALKLFYGSK